MGMDVHDSADADAVTDERFERERQREAYAAFQKRLLAEKLAEGGLTPARAEGGRTLPPLPDLAQALQAQERAHPTPDDLRRREATADALNEWRRHREETAAVTDDAAYDAFEEHYAAMTAAAADAEADETGRNGVDNAEEKQNRRARRRQEDEDWYWYYYFQ